MNNFADLILSWRLSKKGWKPQKHQKNGIQFERPIHIFVISNEFRSFLKNVINKQFKIIKIATAIKGKFNLSLKKLWGLFRLPIMDEKNKRTNEIKGAAAKNKIPQWKIFSPTL